MMLMQNARKARRNPARVVTPADREAISKLRDPDLIAPSPPPLVLPRHSSPERARGDVTPRC